MRLHIATDHAGFELKNHLVEVFRGKGLEVKDHGAHEYDPLDDYPKFCTDAAEAVVADPGSLGIVIGGSGNGEQIAANKVKGARAALVWSKDTARLAREHNDANIISIGARQHSVQELVELIEIFIAEPFSHLERHQRRIELIANYETHGHYELDSDLNA